MVNKGILSKNYYIVPEAVADLGTEVYNMMAEADQAMVEASEIIAEIASLTERVPSHIRCGALLEACESAQTEIKSVDFLSYGQKVEQGLQNLLDHNQYITEHFIKNMETHTEKMRGLGEEFRRLSELITYSGKGVQSNGIVFFPVSKVEVENTDGEEENSSIPGQNDILKHFSSCGTEKLIAIRLLDTQIYNILGITDIQDRQRVIQTILDHKSYVFDNLYILNIYSGADYQRQMAYVLNYAKYVNYVNMVSEVGGWYVSDIHTYCHLDQEAYNEVLETQSELREQGINRGDPGWISTTDRGRLGYTCSLDGNLNGLTVYDDCSSFVTACLIQSGFLEKNTVFYTSYDYIGENGRASQALIDAGFVWYPVSEMTEEDRRNLQPGDIMVKQGHVQIFDHYGDAEVNPSIYAYSWGSISVIEPTETINSDKFVQSYEGIWRLEN